MTPDQTNARRQFKDEYERNKNINTDFFYKDELGSLSLRPQLEHIFKSLSDKIDKARAVVNEIPFQILRELNVFLNEYSNYLFEVFSLPQDDFIKNRQNFIDGLENKYDQFLLIWGKISGIFLAERINEGAAVHKELNDLREQTSKDAERIKILTAEMENKINAFDKRLSEVYSKGEISNQERRFLNTADFNNNQSKRWLLAIWILAGALAVFCFWFLSSCWIDLSCVLSDGTKDSHDQKWVLIYELLRKAFLRILILTIVIFLIKFSVKNYSALKHNFVINRHKANSLDAALNLVFNLPEGVGRDVVINMASKEIFSQHTTGFLSKDQEKIDFSFIEKLISLVKTNEKKD